MIDSPDTTRLADTATADIPGGDAPGKRERAKAANRAAILAAGRRVFARLGFEVTTVRDIIRETDLAAGTFYNYFKSKEDVFEAIAGDSARRFGDRLKSVRSEAADFETYIRTAFRAYFQFLASENTDAIKAGAPHMALIGVRVDTPEVKAIFSEIRSDLDRVLGNDRVAHMDTEYLAAAAVGIAREMGDHMLARRPVDPEAAADYAANLLLSGIRGMGFDHN
ncbi:MAG: TetR/AcrR family transcriptional regulator [Pseudomonadota bacterium]